MLATRGARGNHNRAVQNYISLQPGLSIKLDVHHVQTSGRPDTIGLCCALTPAARTPKNTNRINLAHLQAAVF
jgi:hypothetical protein